MKVYQCTNPNNCGEGSCMVIADDMSAEPETCPYKLWSDNQDPRFVEINTQGWHREEPKGEK